MVGQNFGGEACDEAPLLKSDSASFNYDNKDLQGFFKKTDNWDTVDKYVSTGILPKVGIYDGDGWQLGNPEPKCFHMEPLEPSQIVDITKYLKESNNPAAAARDRAFSELTPKQQEQYESEQKALAAWQRNRMMRESLVDFDDAPPPTPISDGINKRAGEIEQAARKSVYEHMPENERRLLDQERKDYETQLANYFTKMNDPAESTIYMPPMPMPGDRMKAFDTQVRNEIAKGNPSQMTYYLPLDRPMHRYL